MIDRDVDSLIFERLQNHFNTDNPSILSLIFSNDPTMLCDIFIQRSWALGSSLEEDQLEDLWLKMVAEIFQDEELEKLIKERNTGYFWEDTYPEICRKLA